MGRHFLLGDVRPLSTAALCKEALTLSCKVPKVSGSLGPSRLLLLGPWASASCSLGPVFKLLLELGWAKGPHRDRQVTSSAYAYPFHRTPFCSLSMKSSPQPASAKGHIRVMCPSQLKAATPCCQVRVQCVWVGAHGMGALGENDEGSVRTNPCLPLRFPRQGLVSCFRQSPQGPLPRG